MLFGGSGGFKIPFTLHRTIRIGPALLFGMGFRIGIRFLVDSFWYLDGGVQFFRVLGFGWDL